MIVGTFEGKIVKEPRKLENAWAFSLATYGGRGTNEAKETVLRTYWLNCIARADLGKPGLGVVRVHGYLKNRKAVVVNGKTYDQPSFQVEKIEKLDGATLPNY